VWRLLGGDLRLRRNKPLFGSRAALITLLGLLAFGPACAYAVSQDAKQESDPKDPGQSAYADGRFVDWRSRIYRASFCRDCLLSGREPWRRSGRPSCTEKLGEDGFAASPARCGAISRSHE
jgi:hypothetical protein